MAPLPTAGPCPLRVAIVGAGIAGSSAAYGLRRLVRQGRVSLTIFEAAQMAGGRAGTYSSKEMPSVLVDHGAPVVAPRSARFRELCRLLCRRGVLKAAERGEYGTLQAAGDYTPFPDPMREEKERYRSGDRGAAGISSALLRGGLRDGPSLADMCFGCAVRKAVRTSSWQLAGDEGRLGSFDWLVVGAHAVPGAALDGLEVHMSSDSPDAVLARALDAIAASGTRPSFVTLLTYQDAAAHAWAALPWVRVRLKAGRTLDHIVVQRARPGEIAVALHSSAAFAQEAQVQDLDDETVLAAMLMECRSRLAPRWLDPKHASAPCWSHVHRWPAAFPTSTQIDLSQAIIVEQKLAFCGDFVANARYGSIERAALSGLAAADAIARAADGKKH